MLETTTQEQHIEHRIVSSLNTYLEGTRLSMNQVAGKWGVSAPLLSQIRHKKKRPSLELGLRILRESGASLDLRREWIASHGVGGDELGLVIQDERNQRIELKLKKSFSELLESNPILLDLFLDISFQREVGLSWNGILKNYGEYGLELVETLKSAGIVEKEGDRYKVVEKELTHALNLENSLGVVRNIFETLKQKARKEEFRGEFHFDLTDVSPEGYQKLKELNLEYTKKAVALIKENEMSKSKGGIRILNQHITTILKSFVLVFLLSFGAEKIMAQGNGLSGGGSGKLILGTDLDITELKRSLQTTSYSGRTPKIRAHRFGDTIELEYKPTAFLTPYFAKEEDAVESVVDINKHMETGSLTRDQIRHITKNLNISRCENSMNAAERRLLEDEIKKGVIKPLGFKVEQSYSPTGEKRYQALAQYLVPCKVKD